MSNAESMALCLAFMRADTEADAVQLLTNAGYWTDDSAWRLYGDEENNYSTIGNQQATAEAALVEKLTNAMDARLIDACLKAGIDPKSEAAPRSMSEAVGRFFLGAKKTSSGLGEIDTWGDERQTAHAEKGIALAATGQLPPRKPSLTISDSGEGQTPDTMPRTLLSLNKSNKLGIRFVQGQHNMGGTGVLKFCGKHNLQLILSRRDPALVVGGGDDLLWSFTIVRRINPTGSKRSSTYVYLAPIGKEARPCKGELLRFAADEMPIFHKGNEAYAISAPHGTLIKLYEYQYPAAYQNILYSKPSLLNRLEILLPQASLPVRAFECRPQGGKSHGGSYATNLVGVVTRLRADRRDEERNPLEIKPIDTSIDVEGEPFKVTIYALKKKKAETYRRDEGVLFTVNGQTHGIARDEFFTRKKVRMGYLKDSLLVVVDCSSISGRAREELFMNSRDRLSNGTLRTAVLSELEFLVGKNEQLRELQHRRQREIVQDKLKEDKPLHDILKKLISKNPTLSKFFQIGERNVNPYASQKVKTETQPYRGKHTPTFFRFKGKEAGHRLVRQCPINRRIRIDLETDAENGYFDRDVAPGELCVMLTSSSGLVPATTTKTLVDGILHATLTLPESIAVGDILELVIEVIDSHHTDSFFNQAVLTITQAVKPSTGTGTKKKPPTKDQGKDRDMPVGIQAPKINEVTEDQWESMTPRFNRSTALRMIDSGDPVEDGEERPPDYSYFVNVDNVFFKTEVKFGGIDAQVLKTRFKIGLWLVALGLIRQRGEDEKVAQAARDRGDEVPDLRPLEDVVGEVTDAMSPILLPMIAMLGSLDEPSLVAQTEDEDEDDEA